MARAKQATEPARRGRGRGRPSKIAVPVMPVDLAYRLALLGKSNEEIARVIGIGQTTFDRWIADSEEIRGALARGRDAADADIAHSMYHRARGYSHSAVKIINTPHGVSHERYTEHYPPDTQAGMFWLRNRQPKYWKSAPDESGGTDAPPPQKVVIEIQDGRRITPEPDQAAG